VDLNLNDNTLIIATGGNNHNVTGAIFGNGVVRMQDGGSTRIGGSTGNTYTGTTEVIHGPVYLEKSSGNALCGSVTVDNTANLVWNAADQISNTSDVSLLKAGSQLNLAGFADTVASLTLAAGSYVETGIGGVLTTHALTVAGVPMDPGSYTLATHPEFVKGSGSVVVATGGGSTFDTWATTNGLAGAAAAFDADPDNDGVPNGIEFVIGGQPNPGNPGSNSCALLQAPLASGDSLVFTYRLMNEAAYLNPVVEFDADMQGAWTTADSSNATIVVTPGDPAAIVRVTIPKGTNTKLFARLKVTNP
jgi:hypothetical protein